MIIDTIAIKIMLAEKGMSQASLSAACGIARQNISTILRKGRCSIVTAGKIAKGLGVPVSNITKEGI